MTEECESMELGTTASGHEGSREKTVPAPGHTPAPGGLSAQAQGADNTSSCRQGPELQECSRIPEPPGRRGRDGKKGRKRMLF